jgi:signal transduction histidine kinase
MPMTLKSFAGSDIVPQFGFRSATTVGVEDRLQQDVCDHKPFYDEPMMWAGQYARDWLRRRSNLVPDQYSWRFVVMMETAMLLILVGSTIQRSTADLPIIAMAIMVALTQPMLIPVVGTRFVPLLVGVTWWTAPVILMFATAPPHTTDLAPLPLALMVGCVASLTNARLGALAFAFAVTPLAVASATHRLDGIALYLGFVAISLLAGSQMRTQHELLVKQQEMQADLAEHAAADERRRIAREVHDVIAHSLSVTMLHVTGARRALQQDSDIDDAVGALIDAERLGRQAMADVRRTVGLLEAGPTKMAPEPGIADIPDLVEDFVSAGLPVTLQAVGRSDHVSAAVGLALYRITQESLANIAKHATSSRTNVDVSISASTASLAVTNEMPVTVPSTPLSQSGRGLSGMRQRIELLGGILDAGPCRRGWSVRAEIPLNDSSPQTWPCGR